MAAVAGDALYTAAKVLAWAAFHTFFRLRTYGVDQAPRKGPLLVASNHVSSLDPVIVGTGLRRRVYFMARETLLSGFWGWVMQVAGARPIRRDSADRSAIGQALELLERGCSVVMFPEGTRSVNGRVREIRAGIGMIAAKAGCPILPVYIAGAGELLPRGKSLPRPGRIDFLAGPLITPEAVPRSSEAREQYDRIAQQVWDRLRELEQRADGLASSHPS